MRQLLALGFASGFCAAAIACSDDGATLTEYKPDQRIEKINCAGGEKCAECCNDGFCAVGQSCNDGATEDGRIILFCDGPEDCAAPKVCCVKGTEAGAIVGSCADACNNGAKACHVPENCGGEACGTFEAAPYIGVCGEPG